MRVKYFLISLFLLSFLIYSLFFITFVAKDNNYLVCTDSAEYNFIALNIVKNGKIKKVDGDYNFRRLPGYPFFLALSYNLFGCDIKKALWFQVSLSSLIPILIFYLCLALFPSNLLIAKLVSIFSCFNLGFLLYAGMLLSDILFLILFLLFLIIFFPILNQNKNYHDFYFGAFISGFLLGILSLIRPVGHYLLLICLSLVFISDYKLLTKIKIKFIFFMGWGLVVFGWLLRNFLLTGYLFFHTLPGIHFLIYTAAYIDMDKNKCEYSESKKRLMDKWSQKINLEEKEKGKKLLDIESCLLAEKIAFDYIKNNPLIFVKYSFIHIFKTIFGLHSSKLLFFDSKSLPTYDRNTNFLDKIKRFLFPQVRNRFLILFIYLEILSLFFIILGFVGFCFSAFFNKEIFYVLFKTIPFIILFLVITLAYGYARLRLSVEPLLIIWACYFWILVFKKIKEGI